MIANPYFTPLGLGIDKRSLWGVFVLLFTLIPVSHVAAQICTPPPAGLVSWWPGDGDAVDIVGSNDGTLSNQATYATGFVTSGNGQAFSFVRGQLETPLVVSYATGATFDAWIKTTTNGSNTIMTGGGGSSVESGLGMFVGFSGELIYTGSKGIIPHNFTIGDVLINDGVFHHVAGTWTGDTTVDGAKLYVDGNLVNTGTALVGIATDSRPLNIGGHITLGFQKFVGLIDEVEVFNRVLSASEIQAIYDAGTAGKCKSPITVTVEIDIKPGSFPNSINLGSGGATPVAILGSASLDVNDIDTGTLTLGTSGVKTVGKTDRSLCRVVDVSGDFTGGPEGVPDGFIDLVCHFVTMTIVPEAGDAQAKISGALNDTTPIEGTDSVNIVP